MQFSRQPGRWAAAALAATVVLLPIDRAASRVRLPSFTYVLAQAPLDPLPQESNHLRPAEQAFLVDTIASVRAQAELSRLALAQAASSEVREFAQQLITDATEAEIALEALAHQKEVAVPVQPTSYSDDYRQLSQKPGASFDRDFIQRISAANDRALRLCEMAVQNAKDSDIRNLAGNLLPVVRAHVNRTSDLQKSL